MIDLMTVVPILTLNGNNDHCKNYDTADYMNLRNIQAVYFILCGLGTTRILRALRIRRVMTLIEDEVHQYLARIFVNIAVMILFCAALVHYLEPAQGFQFHVWTYYLVVTVSTVGYGDVTPDTMLGRFAAMLIIIFAIITVPQITNELIAKLTSRSVFARARYAPRHRSEQHILICGDISASYLNELFGELFHKDHGVKNLHVVVLQPGLPSTLMKSILSNSMFESKVTYLEGSPLNNRDLDRARANFAKAVFLLTNRFRTNADEEDSKIILQQLSIKRYIQARSQHNELPLFCIQLIRPENKRRLTKTIPLGEEKSHVIICLNEIKMGIISKTLVFPVSRPISLITDLPLKTWPIFSLHYREPVH